MKGQWLDLLAHSGTPLFVSFKSDTITADKKRHQVGPGRGRQAATGRRTA